MPTKAAFASAVKSAKRTLLALSLPCLLLLGGCQSLGSGESHEARINRQIAAELLRMEVRMGEETSSVSNFMVNGFRAINEEALVVTAGVHDHYLITLLTPCLDLPYAFSVGFQSRTSQITTFDSIIVGSLHSRVERCRIDKIFHLEDVEAAADDAAE